MIGRILLALSRSHQPSPNMRQSASASWHSRRQSAIQSPEVRVVPKWPSMATKFRTPEIPMVFLEALGPDISLQIVRSFDTEMLLLADPRSEKPRFSQQSQLILLAEEYDPISWTTWTNKALMSWKHHGRSTKDLSPRSDSYGLVASTQPKRYWLVVWTPLKNMKVNWDDYSQYMGK